MLHTSLRFLCLLLVTDWFGSTATTLALAEEEVTVQQLATGDPKMMEQLGRNGYASFEAKKLANPEVVWVNTDWLRRKGVRIPAEGVTAKFLRSIGDSLGYAIPIPGDPDSAFKQETKIFHADRYGGQGIGWHQGSGRAGSAGLLQWKGIGITPLASNKGDKYHAHGRANIYEGVLEAIWGEVLDRETPYGANRVVAVIKTGTDLPPDVYGPNLPAVLIVREDPLRPGHFVENFESISKFGERYRMENLARRLPDVLPRPGTGAANIPADRLVAGFGEFTDRLAGFFAANFARSIRHGAESITNMELNVKALDYGAVTAVDGFPRLSLPPMDGSHGEFRLPEELLQEFHYSVKRFLPSQLQAALGPYSHWKKRLVSSYNEACWREMLRLTGVPDHVLPALSSSGEGRALAQSLLTIARLGNKRVERDGLEVPKRTGNYDLGAILTKLSDRETLNEESVRKAIRNELPDSRLRRVLVSKYVAFRKRLANEVAQDGISDKALRVFLREATRQRNRKLTELIRGKDLDNRLGSIIGEFLESGDSQKSQAAIDAMIDRNIRELGAPSRYGIVLEDKVDRLGQTGWRLLYDAETAQYTKEEFVGGKKTAVKPVPARALNRCMANWIAGAVRP
ncbi:MAG: hypothetical protein A2428_16790 [Bdellovibrionales bacterium RIFOXYC1_FULL_54_43]|nr:MAG: hypothetical protein A2428_16790 [Bdellovibrionales bacterium RIFOXYC1_FULL_54_43]OFZ84419.1 MAG: hypothetical protein A2603_03200 [Bdellovibrionales bacterium RIFOXYD1_FULL_55_31]